MLRDGDYFEDLNGAHLNEGTDFSLSALVCKSWKCAPLKPLMRSPESCRHACERARC